MSFHTQATTHEPNHNAMFMVWVLKAGVDAKPAFRALCALVENLNNSAAARFPGTQASCVLGIGHRAWQALALPQPQPRELVEFTPIAGDRHTAVATPGDLHLHLRGADFSLCVDMAMQIRQRLQAVADCVVQVSGFRYWDGRSILGFVDGTENPQGDERDFFAQVGPEDAAYEGGSYLFVQKYIHDMTAWRALPVAEQENVIGRSKADDIEMDDDTKPSNSHSALSNVGDDRKIVRDNLPFVDDATQEIGTYFIGYASTFGTVRDMLEAMFIGKPAGNSDRILDFSRAVTGSLFFVPTLDMLGEFAE
ncbi:peroxidase [Comamonas serinivorans]|uniref:Peroxidase n=1 Tax=Comamonas serinivorans TaxID=1082851 RepID=A0A1Y0ENS5_9BURK|nr:Dyp-type peroxidase [Comamonas serinivorans]ARU05295.1 peroxidase [Comamonas serinivorans]